MVYEYIKNIDFAYPYNLSLLMLLPLLIVWYVRKQNKNYATLKVSTTHAFTVTAPRARFRHLLFIFRLLALACLITALARPQKKNEEQRTEGEGIDIMLCIDVSGSMATGDIKPSRLEVAKEVAADFVRGRPVDRIGLVVFAGESFTQCPLTNDQNTLLTQIAALQSDDKLESGTAIGEGLATTADRLSKSQAKSKVIILITDGKEDPTATRLIDPLTALEITKSKGIKVYTIGVGAVQTTISEVATKNQPKNPAIDFIDVDLLQKIATETGGQFFRARDKQALADTYKQIDALEKTKIEVTSIQHVEERFLPFVLAALVFVFLEMVLRFTVLRKFP